LHKDNPIQDKTRESLWDQDEEAIDERFELSEDSVRIKKVGNKVKNSENIVENVNGEDLDMTTHRNSQLWRKPI